MFSIWKCVLPLWFWLAIVAQIADAQNRVLGIYFVEADRQPTVQQEQAIVTQLRTIQSAFLQSFGATFQLADPPVATIRAKHDSRWYAETPTVVRDANTGLERWWRLENMREEILSELNLGADVRIINYPTTKNNGKVGAFVGDARASGAYMDFDDLTCVYGGGESTPFDDGNESVCGAHELHEMGHIFGLADDPPLEPRSRTAYCMNRGFYKSRGPATGFCQFTEANKQIVRSTQQAWLTVTTLDGSGVASIPDPRESDSAECDYPDACGPRILSGNPGDVIRDDCGRDYRIPVGCGALIEV